MRRNRVFNLIGWSRPPPTKSILFNWKTGPPCSYHQNLDGSGITQIVWPQDRIEPGWWSDTRHNRPALSTSPLVTTMHIWTVQDHNSGLCGLDWTWLLNLGFYPKVLPFNSSLFGFFWSQDVKEYTREKKDVKEYHQVSIFAILTSSW